MVPIATEDVPKTDADAGEARANPPASAPARNLAVRTMAVSVFACYCDAVTPLRASLSRFRRFLARDPGACILPSGASSLLPAVLATALILLDDLVLRRISLSYALTALTDEPAHALTALLAVGALIALRPQWGGRAAWWGAGLAGTLIDLDHLPGALGWDGLAHGISDGTDRPYSHSLLTLALVLAVAQLLRGTRRQAALATGLGLAAHLLRDLVDGGTVPLLWPMTKHGFALPYDDYAAWMLLCVALITIGQRAQHERRGGPHPR